MVEIHRLTLDTLAVDVSVLACLQGRLALLGLWVCRRFRRWRAEYMEHDLAPQSSYHSTECTTAGVGWPCRGVWLD